MFETYEAGYDTTRFTYFLCRPADDCRHLVSLVMDSERENPLFRSPIGNDPKHILDLGTGKGVWAMYANQPAGHNDGPKVLTISLETWPICSLTVRAIIFRRF